MAFKGEQPREYAFSTLLKAVHWQSVLLKQESLAVMALQAFIFDWNSVELYLLLWVHLFGAKFGFSVGEAFHRSKAAVS